MTVRYIAGRDVRVGDYIYVIGYLERVVDLEPYDGTLAYTDGSGERARTARFPDGTSMTVFAIDRIAVEDGVAVRTPAPVSTEPVRRSSE